jgi:hypothetical protein
MKDTLARTRHNLVLFAGTVVLLVGLAMLTVSGLRASAPPLPATMGPCRR